MVCKDVLECVEACEVLRECMRPCKGMEGLVRGCKDVQGYDARGGNGEKLRHRRRLRAQHIW